MSQKKETMSRKNRLKRDKIFIENYLTWNKRKIQEKINRWAKKEESDGVVIKIAIRKVRVNGI